MVGDPLQLPPIAEDQDHKLLYALEYRTPFLHNARVWSEVDLRSAELTRVFRQRDPDVIAALNRIRRGEQVEDAVAFLNAACHRPHRPDRTPILLTPTRAAADHHNRAGLAALPGEPTLYRIPTSPRSSAAIHAYRPLSQRTNSPVNWLPAET